MKFRAWIIAAAIAAVSGFATAPTAQACVINPNGECLTSVVKHQPSTGGTHKSAKLAKHKNGHSASKLDVVKPPEWQGPEGTQRPTLYDPTQNQYDPYQYQDIFSQVQQPTSGS